MIFNGSGYYNINNFGISFFWLLYWISNSESSNSESSYLTKGPKGIRA